MNITLSQDAEMADFYEEVFCQAEDIEPIMEMLKKNCVQSTKKDKIEFGIAAIDASNNIYTSWYDYEDKKIDITDLVIHKILSNKPNVNIDNPLAVNFGIAINQPSQTLSFDVDVLNEGAMDAQVSDVSLVGLENVSDAVTYEVSGINVGDVIAAGDSATVKVVVTSNYVYDATLNFAAINLDNVSLKVNFVQAK